MSIKKDIGRGAIAIATIALVPGSIPFFIAALTMRGIRRIRRSKPRSKMP